MKKITLGTPEKLVPSLYCDTFNLNDYGKKEVAFDEGAFICRQTARGFVAELPLDEGTEIFGFGLQLKRIRHTGKKVTLRVNADPLTPCGDSHAPVPFLVTNRGWGLYFDTLRYAEIYCGAAKNASAGRRDGVRLSTDELYAADTEGERYLSVFIPCAQGVDVYAFAGDSMLDVVAQYNMLAGGGCDVPEWGLEPVYRVNGGFTSAEALKVAREFREKDIPVGTIGLEPGWHTHAYSCTYVWNKERFPDPAGFVGELRDMGYHVNLWQHAFVHPDSPIHGEMVKYSGDYRVWDGLVPDFSLPGARKLFADYQRENLAALGVDGFKADECDGSDNTGGWSFPNHTAFPSGLDGEQYHSLFGTLYAKTLWEALDGKPTLSSVRSIGALAAPYPFVLYSDLYDLRDFVRGVINAGFCGLLWSPEVRDAKSGKELVRRLQVNVFSVQCLINAWYCKDLPWRSLGCENEVRALFELRKKLIPKLKEAFARYHETGVPPVRALVTEYGNDPETYGIEDEYLFCDDLLVAPICDFDTDTREVYLPAGEWTDFYTGEPVNPGKFTVTTKDIPVFVRKK